jgi:hypothetical protein
LTSLLRYLSIMPMILLFLAPLISNWFSFPMPLFFFASVECGGAIQIQILQTKLGRWNCCLIFVCWVFLIIHVFGKWWLIMCLFFSVGIFGHCTFSYIHSISFAQLHYVFFEHIAFYFSFNCL